MEKFGKRKIICMKLFKNVNKEIKHIFKRLFLPIVYNIETYLNQLK